MWVTSSLAKALTPTSVALGKFDGLHRGHQQVIQPILDLVDCQSPVLSRQSSGVSSNRPRTMNERVYSTVVAFNPHPQEFFTGQRRSSLTTLDEKVQQLTCLGVEQLVLLPFDRKLSALSPQQFVEEILVQHLRAQSISVGQDFRFGWRRSGTAADLQAIAATFGISVTTVSLQVCEDERISSSSIRQNLTNGDIQRANQLLGRPYTLTGLVVQGQQLGRTIGFPTANLQLPPEKLLPRQGVYAGRVLIEEVRSAECGVRSFLGVINIGSRPTVNGTSLSIEVHLLDWSGDLYGKTIKVELEKFLRPEQKFASLEALKAQIAADCDRARVYWSANSASRTPKSHERMD